METWSTNSQFGGRYSDVELIWTFEVVLLHDVAGISGNWLCIRWLLNWTEEEILKNFQLLKVHLLSRSWMLQELSCKLSFVYLFPFLACWCNGIDKHCGPMCFWIHWTHLLGSVFLITSIVLDFKDEVTSWPIVLKRFQYEGSDRPNSLSRCLLWCCWCDWKPLWSVKGLCAVVITVPFKGGARWIIWTQWRMKWWNDEKIKLFTSNSPQKSRCCDDGGKNIEC